MQLTKPFSILICGRPGSGKSQLIRFILCENSADYSTDPFKFGIVMCNTSFNNSYDYIPDNYVHSKFDISIIENMMMIQESTNAVHRAFLVLDDCLPQGEFNNQIFTRILTQFRHLNISIIIATQYIYKVPPTFRECATHVAIFKQTTKRSFSALFESFGSYFESLNDFMNYVQSNTGDYKFILYSVNSSSKEIKDLYQVKKAPKRISEFNYSF